MLERSESDLLGHIDNKASGQNDSYDVMSAMPQPNQTILTISVSGIVRSGQSSPDSDARACRHAART
jgi:hypothetical protein